MAAPELLCRVMGFNAGNLSREENFIVEAELFTSVCDALTQDLKSQYRDYFRLIKFNKEVENHMLETNFIRFILNDILVSGEYSVEGVACYTQVPEEVISDLMVGKNPEPSLPLSRKIINLHRSVRPELYKSIMRKLTSEHMQE